MGISIGFLIPQGLQSPLLPCYDGMMTFFSFCCFGCSLNPISCTDVVCHLFCTVYVIIRSYTRERPLGSRVFD